MKILIARLVVAALALGASTSAIGQEPQPTLTANWDIAILLDASGSVSDSLWQFEQDLAKDLIRSFDFGPSLAAATVGAYGTTARSLIDMAMDRNGIINAISAATNPVGGSTCQTCAFELASAQFTQFGRAGLPKVTIFVTDGVNNVGTAEEFSIALAQLQATSAVFGIGIGGVSPSVIDAMGSDLLGIQTTFLVNEFNRSQVMAGLFNNFALYAQSLSSPPQGAVPEPGTYALLLAGLALLALEGKRRRRWRLAV